MKDEETLFANGAGFTEDDKDILKLVRIWLILDAIFFTLLIVFRI